MKKKVLSILAVISIFLVGFLLRFFRLGEVPASLYWDEASLGYNAYSIATTLHDEHGEFLPIQRFIAFGDYKPPGYIYAAAASIKLLGLSEFSIRLPSALAGTLLVVVCYFLTLELFKNKKTSLIASILLAISPWSLQMSRAAFEGNLATLFSGAGILFFLFGLNTKKTVHYFLSSLFFVLSVYTFNSHRVFVPLMLIFLSAIYFKEILNQKKNFFIFVFSCTLFLSPLIPYFMTRESRLRFEETSWTKDLAPIELSNQRILLDDGPVANVIHNRRISYIFQFLQHYSDNFKIDFLFYSGDPNDRLSTQKIGMLYWIELPLLLIGLYQIIKNRNKASVILLTWLLLAPIPAALARETPHALRILQILPVPQIIIAMGIWRLLEIKNLKFIFFGSYLLFFSFYIFDYYKSYPSRSATGWQYGYKQMVENVKKIEHNYPCVSITEDAGRPYIYFLLYNKYLPEKYWQTRVVDRDWFGFWYVRSFDKYYFGHDPGNCLKVDYVNSKFTISNL